MPVELKKTVRYDINPSPVVVDGDGLGLTKDEQIKLLKDKLEQITAERDTYLKMIIDYHKR